MSALHIVDHTSWRRRELEASGLEVKHSYGLEIPYFDPKDIWWMPQGYAVELNSSLRANDLPTVKFTAPGPYMLALTPQELTQREIRVISVEEAISNPQDGWWKAAEAKIEDFPSEFRTSEELLRDIENSKLPNQSLLQFSSKRLDIKKEFRSFISENRVLTTSIYLQFFPDGSSITVYDRLETVPDEILQVEDFLTDALRTFDSPRSMTTDVALLEDGSLAILEFNPSWCSAWYECDIKLVVESIKASFSDPNWEYVPDMYMQEKSDRRRPLPLSPEALKRWKKS